MKNSCYSTARGWKNQCSGNTKNNKPLLLLLASLIWGALGLVAIHAAPDPFPNREAATANTNAVPAAETNSPVTAIATDLQRIKARIEGAVAAMTNAVNSTPAVQTAKVVKLADDITAVASKELADDGEMVKQAEALIAKFNESVTKARKAASDPNVGASAREVYSRLLPGLEAEVGKLIDAKATVARIRGELLRQAEGLRQSADAIGFAEHVNQLALASAAFRAALSETVAFTEKISTLIQSVGKAGGIPLS